MLDTKQLRGNADWLAVDDEADDPDHDRLNEISARVRGAAEALDKAGDEIERLGVQVKSMQADRDRLMLEHCPDEMAPGQVERWADHQRPSAVMGRWDGAGPLLRRGLAIAVISVLAGQAVAQDMDATYACVADLHVHVLNLNDRHPEYEVAVDRGADAACTLTVTPADLTWNTDCLFYSLTSNDRIEVSSRAGAGDFWRFTLVSLNERTKSVRVLTVFRLANRDYIQFSITAGSGMRAGICHAGDPKAPQSGQ